MIKFYFSFKNPKSSTAFSLVEISVVILVIGILIAGVSQGIDLYQDTKLATARSLTTNSRVGRIDGLVLWLETTLPNNFSSGTTTFNNIRDITNNTSINRWRDINPTSISPIFATQTSSAGQPKIIIDRESVLPMLNFTSSSSQFMGLPNGSLPFGNSAYSVIFLIKSANSGGAILSAGFWGTKTTNVFYGSSSMYRNVWVGSDLGISSTELKLNSIAITTYDQIQRKTYINGELKGSNIDGNLNAGTFPNYIGRRQGSPPDFYNGDIGEIIIYDRTLSDNERKDIEQYLAKKWNIKI